MVKSQENAGILHLTWDKYGKPYSKKGQELWVMNKLPFSGIILSSFRAKMADDAKKGILIVFFKIKI